MPIYVMVYEKSDVFRELQSYDGDEVLNDVVDRKTAMYWGKNGWYWCYVMFGHDRGNCPSPLSDHSKPAGKRTPEHYKRNVSTCIIPSRKGRLLT